tara:strand:- start:1621 stop:4803 length:3183 start_codon:yes stop_codon:yes gene_type:complete
MAYNKTYSFRFSSTAGVKYILEFYDQVAGSWYHNKEGRLGAGACDISWGSEGSKMYSTVKASTMSIDFMVTDVQAASYINELRTSRQERDVYVYLYVTGSAPIIQSGDSPIFAGYLLMDLADDPDVPVPYNIKLKAVDGLAALKYYDLIPSGIDQAANNLYEIQDTFMPDSANPAGQYDQHYTFLTWISRILYYTGYATTAKGSETNAEIQTSCNWFNGNMANTTGDPLAWSRITAAKFYKTEGETGDIMYKPKTCYEALVAICNTWGMRCFMYKNTFYFISINNYSNNNSGTLAAPVNIDYHRYNIDGTAASTPTGEALDLQWGRYYLPVSLTSQNKKLSGSQYGILPAFKKVTVTFSGVSNDNYFQAFPLFTTPSPTTASTGQRKYEDIGVITTDGTATLLFYTEIWMNFVNNNTSDATVNVPYTFVAREVGSTGVWKEMYFDWNASPPTITWYNQAGAAPTLDYINALYPYDTFNASYSYNEYTIPPGPSSINITDMNPFLALDTTNFPAGDYDVRFKVANQITSVPNPNWYGFGRVDVQGGGSDLSPDDGNITMANSGLTVGMGASMVSPVIQGSVGIADQNTQVTQAGDDTAHEIIKKVLWGDGQSQNSAIQVYTGSAWVDSGYAGFWGVDTVSGNENFAALLAQQVFLRQAKNVKKLNTKIAMDLRYNSSDGSGTRPMYGTPFTRWYTPSHMTSGTSAANWIMHTGTFSPVKDTWKLKLYEFKTFTATLTTTTTNDGGLNTGGVGDQGNDVPDAIDGSQAKLGSPNTYLINNAAKYKLNKPNPLAIISTAAWIDPTSGTYAQAITSLAVEEMPDAILKQGDTILLKAAAGAIGTTRETANPRLGNDIVFEVSSDQAAGATSISVTSKTINQNILKGDEIHISQADLVTQYQNKSKGTIGGMAVTATSLGPITYDSAATNKYDIIGVDQDYIKILPRDFMNNDDSAGDMVVFKDAANSGVKVENTGLEMYAFVSIPYGKTATVVTVYGNNTKNVEVYEMDVNATGLGTAIGSGTVGSAVDITDTASTATNFLAIKVVVTNVNNLIYGGIVTLIDS